MSDLRVAVDASRVRSGGGVAHLVGILDIDEPAIFGIKEIHVWALVDQASSARDRNELAQTSSLAGI